MSGETNFSLVSSTTIYTSAYETLSMDRESEEERRVYDDTLGEMLGSTINSVLENSQRTPSNNVQNEVFLDESERLTPQVPENGQNMKNARMELNFEEKIEFQVEQHQNIQAPNKTEAQKEEVPLNAEVHSAPSPNENKVQNANLETVFAAPMPQKNHFGGSGRITSRVANSAPLVNSTNVPHYMYPTFSAVRRIEETQKKLAMRSASRVEEPKRIERKFSNSRQ